jgi:hypothetical protein
MEGEKIDYSKLTEGEIRKKAEDMSTVFDAAQEQKEKEGQETEEESIRARIFKMGLRMEDYEEKADEKEISAALNEIMNKIVEFKNKFEKKMLEEIGYKSKEQEEVRRVLEVRHSLYKSLNETVEDFKGDFKYKIERVKTNLDLEYVCTDADTLTFEEFKESLKSRIFVPGKSEEENNELLEKIGLKKKER